MGKMFRKRSDAWSQEPMIIFVSPSFHCSSWHVFVLSAVEDDLPLSSAHFLSLPFVLCASIRFAIRLQSMGKQEILPQLNLRYFICLQSTQTMSARRSK